MSDGKNASGFTLIEILLIVAGLAILAGITVVAINPLKQLGEARDNKRRVDISTIWNAVQQYALNNHGAIPAAIPPGTLEDCLESATSTEFTICRSGACDVVLTELLEESAYLAEIPTDPSVSDENYSGYNIVEDTLHNDRVTVCAPAAEESESIYLPN